MRIHFGLTPFLTPTKSDDLPFSASVNDGGGLVPDKWAGIVALPGWSNPKKPDGTPAGDNVDPVDGKTVLSFQGGTVFQARPEGTAGAWEVVDFGGGFFSLEKDGNLVGPFPYAQVS